MQRGRTNIESTNRKFIQNRIDKIEALDSSIQEGKLRKMSLYWLDLLTKSYPDD